MVGWTRRTTESVALSKRRQASGEIDEAGSECAGTGTRIGNGTHSWMFTMAARVQRSKATHDRETLHRSGGGRRCV